MRSSGWVTSWPATGSKPSASAITLSRWRTHTHTAAPLGPLAAKIVVGLTAAPAPGMPDSGRCVPALVAIESGPNRGANTLLAFSPGPGQPNLAAGDHIRIIRQADRQGATSYGFYDFERTWPLVVIAALFAVVIVAVARWRGPARAGRHPRRVPGAGRVSAAGTARRRTRGAGGVGRVGRHPLRRDLSGARGQPADQRRAVGHVDIDGVGGRVVIGRNRTRPSYRAVRGSEQPGGGLYGQCVDHRAAARRVHHRVARCAERRDGDPGVGGFRAGRDRR
jgi:hypothetical protein